MPSSVTVPEGTSRVLLPVVSTPVAASVNVTVSASLGETTASRFVRLLAPSLSSFTRSSTCVVSVPSTVPEAPDSTRAMFSAVQGTVDDTKHEDAHDFALVDGEAPPVSRNGGRSQGDRLGGHSRVGRRSPRSFHGPESATHAPRTGGILTCLFDRRPDRPTRRAPPPHGREQANGSVAVTLRSRFRKGVFPSPCRPSSGSRRLRQASPACGPRWFRWRCPSVCAARWLALKPPPSGSHQPR